MIVVTGAAGFIGSNVVKGLNDRNYRDIVLVDDFSHEAKRRNYGSAIYRELVERKDLFRWLGENHRFVQFVIHMGARTDTAEFSWDLFLELNLEYSKKLWHLCVEFGIPVIYASSAATYGLGELGYDDDHGLVPQLKPLNPYGRSKAEFDKWVLQQVRKPFFWAGFRFFNVYGPGEYHKGRMASVVYHAFSQIKETGRMELFRSHHPEFADGEQARDFIYVRDVVRTIIWMMELRPVSGIFNLGTGRASTFLDLVSYTFRAMAMEPVIRFTDTPEDIRDKYQYFTEAKMEKLRAAGFGEPFTPLEAGIKEYVQKYLLSGDGDR